MSFKAIALAALTLSFASTAAAQQPRGSESESTPPISLGELQPTAQMWFYEQAMQQYHDPKASVRAKAEFRAAQRQRRLASSKWFGISNARPMASTTPTMGTYSPVWTSGNWDPSQWYGTQSSPIVVVRDVEIEEEVILRR